MSNLTDKQCKPCEGGVCPMGHDAADTLLHSVAGWSREDSEITRIFEFKNYYETIAFVNASAFISHQEDHHPDLVVGYKTCSVTYTTHAIGGLSENDFICAAKLNKLIA